MEKIKREIKNVFSNPDEVRKIALGEQYFKSPFNGKRSDKILKSSFICESIISALIPELISNNIFNFELNAFFQYNNKNDSCIENIDKLPINNNIISGLIYLNPELPDGDYGTIADGEKISNEYNKLVYYTSDVIYKSAGTFGNDLEDSRLVIFFILSKK